MRNPTARSRSNPIRQVGEAGERVALGDLQHHPRRVGVEGLARGVERLVAQLAGVEVDEEEGARRGGGDAGGDARADGAPQLQRAAEALGGVEELARSGQRALVAAHQRLVAEDAQVGPVDDGLVGNPQRGERGVEAHGEPRQRRLDAPVGAALVRLATFEIQSPAALHRVRGELRQRAQIDRLEEERQRPLLDGALRQLGGVVAGGEDDRHLGIGRVDGVEQREAVHARHGHVADDRVNLAALEHQLRALAVGRGEDAEALRAQGARVDAHHRQLVVDDEHRALARGGRRRPARAARRL